ncbi:ash family protein [Escherichia coli p0305293.10]|nr:ash family protein [Escherichia coli p0305293.10]
MVAQAGQPPGWPVSYDAGILTPVWAIAIERENSGDSVIYALRRLPYGYNPYPLTP